ncbi:MAG TPA: acyl-CoA dehydrogenase family protein [Vicinamibacterales bacterium]|nr:acyl-CoA dehydrogenase family protein [Vicinamibacterales bacterium]
MTERFTAAHERFRVDVRAFVERELRPHAERWERARRLPRRALASCARQGWMSLEPWEQAVVAEELPRCDSLGLALSVFVQANLIGPLIEQLGTPAQKAAWLEPVRRGRMIGALAVSEPDAGSDFSALQTTGRRRADHLVLDGTKTYVTNAAAGDLLIVAARTDGEGLAGLSLVAVPRRTRGVRVEPLDALGLATSGMGRITLAGCRVPAANVLGSPGGGFGYILQALDRERLLGAFAAVSWASYALERTIVWAKRRHAFGRPLARIQVVRHQVADAAIALEAARQLNYATFAKWTAGGEVAKEIAMIKVFSYEAAQRVIDRCLQLHGGAGYMAEHWASRYYRDARALTIAAGTPEVMKELIAAHLRL